METSQRSKLVRLLVTLALCNLALGVLMAIAGLQGVFWGTLAEAGERLQQSRTGIALPKEYMATPLYFWWQVIQIAVGLGLILGAAAMVQRMPGGRVLNVFVAAGGMGLFLVAIFGGLLEGPRDWGWALIRMGYLTALVVLLWQRRVRELWRRPIEASE